MLKSILIFQKFEGYRYIYNIYRYKYIQYLFFLKEKSQKNSFEG